MQVSDLMKESRPSSTVSVQFEARPMFVRKGFKKAPFIAGVDDPKFRKTQVDLTFTSDDSTWTRSYLTFSREWQEIIFPSILAALPNMTDTAEIDGIWEIENVPNGDTYTADDGTIKPRTSPKFIRKLSDDQFSDPTDYPPSEMPH